MLAAASDPDDRATRLRALLDARYFAFVEGLPPALQAPALQASTYSGSGGDAPFTGVSSLNPGLTATPWLFWEAFAGLDDEAFLAVAEAGALVVLASIVLDHIVDAQLQPREMLVVLQNALYQGGTARFRAALPPASPFWAHFERLTAEHVAGLAGEIEARAHPERFSRRAFETMVRAKFAPIACTTAGLAVASGQPHLIGPIEESIKRLAVASQLLDDVGDWQSDLVDRHLTYYLAQLAPAECWLADRWPAAGELQPLIDAAWHDARHLRLTIEWLDGAVSVIQDLKYPGWVNYINDYRELADKHLTATTARHLARALQSMLPTE